jgi:hypothetical protein
MNDRVFTALPDNRIALSPHPLLATAALRHQAKTVQALTGIQAGSSNGGMVELFMPEHRGKII